MKDHSLVPNTKDYLAISRSSRGPLSYVLLEDPVFLDEIIDNILANCYCGESGSLIFELESCLPYEGPIYKNDDAVVCMSIEEDSRRTLVKSNIKYFYALKGWSWNF